MTKRRPSVALAYLAGSGRNLETGVLQPELGRLVHDLEQQLVVVHPLRTGLLERQELIGAQVALIVTRRVAGENRCVVVSGIVAHRFVTLAGAL